MKNRKIFVGNLKYTVTEEQLRNFFSKHGKVLNVKVMKGKGYAFVEMGTPEQALRIKNTLSESLFEGRRMLIDSVPSKENAIQKRKKTQSESRPAGRMTEPGRDRSQRKYRNGASEASSDRSIEPVHHLTDVTEELTKGRNVDRVRGKPVQKQKSQPYSDRNDTRTNTPSPTVRETRKPASRQPERDRPGNKPGQAEQSQRKTRQPTQPGRDSERRAEIQKPEKVMKAPSKNPHPYQGSKKTKKPGQPEGGKETSSQEPKENEKRKNTRYWATISGKKKK